MLELSDLRTVPLFDGLRDDQLEELLAGGAEVPIVPGEVVWLEGCLLYTSPSPRDS